MANRWGKQWKQWQTLYCSTPKSLWMVTAVIKLKDSCSLEDSCDKPRQCIIKHRHYFADKVLSSQSYGFSSIMYICESWTIKKAEHQIIDAFKLWCWRRLLRLSGTARKSNQSILREINPEYSLEGLMLKLKLQYFGHLMQRADLLEKPWSWERLRARGERDYRGWEGWMASLTQWTGVWENSRS